MDMFYHILGAKKLEVHLQISPEVSPRAGCSGKICLGITSKVFTYFNIYDFFYIMSFLIGQIIK